MSERNPFERIETGHSDEVPARQELPQDESGVRLKPDRITEEQEDKEHRQRLIIGATKHILKILKEELTFVKKIKDQERALDLAYGDEALRLEEDLEALYKTYHQDYTLEGPTGKKLNKNPNFTKRLEDLNGYIAKQEGILAREIAHLKTSPQSESASGH